MRRVKDCRHGSVQERNNGVDVDAKYGIRRSPGVKPHLYIRPRAFGDRFDRFKHLRVKTPVKKLPSQVSKYSGRR